MHTCARSCVPTRKYAAHTTLAHTTPALRACLKKPHTLCSAAPTMVSRLQEPPSKRACPTFKNPLRNVHVPPSRTPSKRACPTFKSPFETCMYRRHPPPPFEACMSVHVPPPPPHALAEACSKSSFLPWLAAGTRGTETVAAGSSLLGRGRIASLASLGLKVSGTP
jgi:hypothetical protein